MRMICLGLLAVIGSGAATAQTTPAASTAAEPVEHGPHLSGETVTLPLVLVKGYPFVEGAINGKTGKLLFDLGDNSTVSLNSHAISPPGAVVTGQGFYGSGQSHPKLRFPKVDTLSLPGGLRYTAMTNIRGSSGLVLEQHITPDFIGWLGLRFFAGYVAKLDYAKPSVTFYRNDATDRGLRAATAGETVVKTIRLGGLAHPNVPTYPAKIGALSVVGTVDSGAHIAAWLNDAQIAALERAGNLKKDGHGDYTVSGILADGLALPPSPLIVFRERPPFAKYLPQPDAPVLVLGYEFLKRYTTVMDYQQGTMTLLQPKP